MQISKSLRLGKNEYLISSDGVNLFSAVEGLDKFRSLHTIAKCGICGEDNLSLRSYKTKTRNYEYTIIQCNNPDCRGSLTISENPATKERYYRKNKEKELDWKKPDVEVETNEVI